MKELISVIVPVYNVEEYLDRCIYSIINQTYSNLEILLIDDGSTDKSGELCDQWAQKDARIKVIHKENGGLSNARNVGLEFAAGDYVAFVDSDDWIELNMYEYLFDLIKRNAVDVAFCDFRRLKAHKRIKKQKEQIIVRKDQELDDFFYRLNGEKSSYAVWCGLYKMEKIKDIKFIEGEINEDVLFRYELYKRVRTIVFSNLCKYNYFLNLNGITLRKLSRKDTSLFKIWDIIVEREKGTENYQYALLNRMRATYTLYVKYLLKGNSDVDRDEIKRWKREIKGNYQVLSISNALDWKRKVLLFFIAKCKG